MGSGMRARVGVIGAGSWAIANHIPILAARDDVELVSAVRTNRKALALLQARFGFDHVSDDYREALDFGLDAVVIAGPAGLHYEHARAALEAGAAVLCEKPFTTDPGHAWDLHDIASQRGLHLLLALGWNYRPTAVESKRLMEDPGVGAVQHVLVAMVSGLRGLLHGTGSYRGQDAFFHLPGGPGPIPDCPGAIRSGGPQPRTRPGPMAHRPASLTGIRLRQQRRRRDRSLRLHQRPVPLGGHRLDPGSVVGAGGSAVDQEDAPWPRHQLQVRIYGTEGHLVADLERDFLWLFREDGRDIKVDLPARAGLYACDEPPNVLIDLTLGMAAKNRSPADVGARTVEILSAAYDSVRAGAVANIVTRHRSSTATP